MKESGDLRFLLILREHSSLLAASRKLGLTPSGVSQRLAKARRKAEFMTIFVSGRQRRLPRPVLIDGLDPEEFIVRNADPIWLHQNGMWEYLAEAEGNGIDSTQADADADAVTDDDDDDDDIPFVIDP